MHRGLKICENINSSFNLYKNMNWKVVAVSSAAFFLVIGLVYFQIIGTDIGIITSIMSLVGIFSPILSQLLKPKVSLKIERPELEKREYGNHEGYKIKTCVTNQGKKIVFNLTASIHVTKQVDFLKITIETKNGHKTYKVSGQPFKADIYSWIDKEGKTLKDTSLNQLRKDDSMKLVFPEEARSGGFVGVGTIGRSMRTTSWDYDTLLKAEAQNPYRVEIIVKGEDFEKNTIIKKREFKINFP
jgi:hypothetical protein